VTVGLAEGGRVGKGRVARDYLVRHSEAGQMLANARFGRFHRLSLAVRA
jgi:hypothetical protein